MSSRWSMLVFLVHVMIHMNSQASCCPSGEPNEQIKEPSVLGNKPEDNDYVEYYGDRKIASAPHFNAHASRVLHAYTAEYAKHN